MIKVGKDYWLITRDQEQPSYLGSSTNCELVSVINAVSVEGNVILPIVILPRNGHQEY
jgi:hypothetical protein